jgi:hypothetical protein
MYAKKLNKHKSYKEIKKECVFHSINKIKIKKNSYNNYSFLIVNIIKTPEFI